MEEELELQVRGHLVVEALDVNPFGHRELELDVIADALLQHRWHVVVCAREAVAPAGVVRHAAAEAAAEGSIHGQC